MIYLDRKDQLNQAISVALIAVSTIGMAMIWMFGVPVIDDFWFKQEYLRLLEETGNGFHASLSSLIDRAKTDNVRLPNQILVFMQGFDYRPWAGAVTAVCWVVTIISALRITGTRLRNPAIVGLLLAAWLLGLPWEEYMSSAPFYLNYVAPTALVFITLWMFVSGRYRMWIGLIAAWLTGWSHEAAGFTVVAAMTGYLLFDHGKGLRRRMYLWLSAMVSSCLHLLAPAFKVHGEEYGLGHYAVTANMIFEYPIVWLLIAISIFVACLQATGRMRKVSTAQLAMYCGGGVAATVFFCLLPSYHRSGWFGLSLVYCGYVYLISQLRMSNAVQRMIAIPILALACWHFTAVSIEVFKVRRLYLPALEAYRQNGYKPIFTKILAEKDIEEASLGRGSRLAFQPGVAAFNVANYLGGSQNTSVVFIPRELEDISENAGEKVAGDNDIYIKDGYLYRQAHTDGCDPFRIETAVVTRGKITRRERLIVGYFRTPDGAAWEYLATTARLFCSTPVMRIEKEPEE